MNRDRCVFSQLCDFLPTDHFKQLVKGYEGNKYVRSFTCWNHLMVLLFGQLLNRKGLRDLIVTTTPFKSAFYHLGFGRNVSRNNLSKTNEIREVKIFQEFADKMVSITGERRGVIKGFFISDNVYAFDSSAISLCLPVYWWTKLHYGKGGVRSHELYDVETDIPIFSIITDASIHDSQVMELIPYEKESFYISGKAYMAAEKFYIVEEAEAYFVVKEKHKISFKVIEDKEYNSPSSEIMADQIIRFKGHKAKKQYPNKLQRVVFYDYDDNRTFVFYTNDFEVTAEQVAMLYEYRWRVELFFKQLKQHLCIEEFYGTSENAVKIQICVSIIAYCLVAIVQECVDLRLQTYDALGILGTALLTKIPSCNLLIEQKEEEFTEGEYQQLCLSFNG